MSADPRRIRSHRNYTVKEVSSLLGIHKQTVRRWTNQGLLTIDARRPLLVIGSDLKQFVEQKRKARRRSCPTGQLYCVRCRLPKAPAGNMVDWLPRNAGSGLLRGICPDCGGLIHRGATFAKLEAVANGLDVTLPMAQRGLCGPSSPHVNVHFDGERYAKE